MKVHYSLKNVHYAPMMAAEEESGWPSYGTPIPWPGAVELGLEAQGSIAKFYADGICYWQSAANNGYEGDLTVALVIDQFRVDCLGERLHEVDKTYLEKASANSTPFALLFEFEGDEKPVKHVLYNCTASRPGVSGKTVEEERTPDTESLTISAAALGNGYVKARTGDETTDSVVSSWYEEVYQPSQVKPT